MSLTYLASNQQKIDSIFFFFSNFQFCLRSYQVKVDIENSIGDIRPKIKEEIRQMGKRLADHAGSIQVSPKAILDFLVELACFVVRVS